MPRLKSVTDSNGTKIYPVTITRGVYDTDKNQRLNETLANKADNTIMGASGNNHAPGLVPDTSSTAGTTKYLREDGTWQEPPNNNTTYSLSVGIGEDANKIILTPSNGTANKITVPYATDAGTVSGKTVGVNVPSDAQFTDTTYESKAAESGGTAVSLVTTGEKYIWGQKQDALTFNTTPSSSNKVATMADIPSSLPASDVYSWAKEQNKPSYAYSEIGYEVNTTTANGVYTGAITIDGSKPLHVIAITGDVTVTLSTNPSAGHSTHVLFTSTVARTVTINHDNTSRVCPEAKNVTFNITANGYAEVDFLNANSKIYVRGV